MKRVIKKSKNEDGYVLIVVILLVVLIMGFSSVFMTNAITHTKQEEDVDQQHLTVAAAEMGVEYYTTALINEYHYRIPQLEQAIGEELIKNNEILNKETYIDIQEIVKENLMGYLNEALQGFTTASEAASNYSYKLKEPINLIKTDEANNSIRVSGTVLGSYVNGEIFSELDFSQYFHIPFFQSNYDLDNPNPEVEPPTNERVDISSIFNEEFLKHDTEQPSKKCTNINNGRTLIDEKCYLDNHSSYINNNPLKLFDNSLLYATHHLTVTSNIELKDSRIHAENKLSTQNSPLNMDNSILFTSNDFEANQGMNVSNGSDIYIDGHTYLKNSNSFINNSRVFIKKHLEVTGNASLNATGSTLVIGNKLTIQNNDLNLKNSSVYVGNHVSLPVGSVNVEEQSNLYIDGHLDIKNEGKLKVQSNSKVCITNIFNIGKTNNIIIEEGSFVYLNKKSPDPSNKRIINKTSEEMKLLCSGSPSTEIEDEELKFQTLEPVVDIDVTY